MINFVVVLHSFFVLEKTLLLPILATTLFACGAGSDKHAGGTSHLDAATTSTTDAGTVELPETSGDDGGGGFVLDGALPETATPTPSCVGDEITQIYVLGKDNSLQRFDPVKRVFSRIATLACGTSAGPNSMAVDRHGSAWVNYNDGSFFKVSTKDGSCPGPALRPTGITKQVGMAFVSDGGDAETLYLASFDGFIVKFDTTAVTTTRVGSIVGDAELTGTGDGHLFAFIAQTIGAPTSASTVAPFDRIAGRMGTAKPVPDLKSFIDSWAFAFWGGTFWMFAHQPITSLSMNSSVVDFDYIPGTSSVIINDAGFQIVGAGVSTCAPLKAPPPR